MPIHPDQRDRYPQDWKQISAARRAAAGHCCERCGVADRAWGWRDADGAFQPVDQDALRADHGPALRPPFTMRAGRPFDPVRIIEIVLTVAHLDHQPENNVPENLAALCQRCHLGHDRAYHQARAAQRRREAMATPELPLHRSARPREAAR